MTSLYAIALGALAAGSLWLLFAGWHPLPAPPREQRLTPAQQWAKITRRPPGSAGRRRDIGLLVSVGVGIALWLATGWLVCVVAAPIAWLLLPKLFVAAPPNDLLVLEALDRWVRHLTTTIPTGVSVIDAIRKSRHTAPELIASEVGRLVDRIDAGASPDQALLEFARDLDSREGEAIVMALSVAVTSTTGVTGVLKELASGIHDRIRALREIETDRAKPRGEARQTTIVSLVLLGAIALFSRGFLSAYSTWLGQIVLAALLAVYAASLWQLWRLTIPRRRARILVRHQSDQEEAA